MYNIAPQSKKSDGILKRAGSRAASSALAQPAHSIRVASQNMPLCHMYLVTDLTLHHDTYKYYMEGGSCGGAHSAVYC